jgi:hypothetical protein
MFGEDEQVVKEPAGESQQKTACGKHSLKNRSCEGGPEGNNGNGYEETAKDRQNRPGSPAQKSVASSEKRVQSILFGGITGIWFAILLIFHLHIATNGFVNLVAMHRYFLRGLDAQAYLVATNFDDDDRNVIVDDNTLVLFPR